ncbi:MAG: transcriptional regulator [Actinobacteria bacterium HGW-Actinobacteria-4]|nr:MAG: transcriptional regulator [Actinobacteria bacterium HGW-Actinobacteria-4]
MTTVVPLTPREHAAPLVCEPLGKGAVISDREARDLALHLKALGEPTRLKIVTYLLSEPGHEACICDLAPMVGLTDATVNHHLKTLAAAGIVTKQRRGMNVHYAVVPDAIRAIARVLT